MTQPTKTKHIDTENTVVVTRGEGAGKGKMDQRGQLYGDG